MLSQHVYSFHVLLDFVEVQLQLNVDIDLHWSILLLLSFLHQVLNPYSLHAHINVAVYSTLYLQSGIANCFFDDQEKNC